MGPGRRSLSTSARNSSCFTRVSEVVSERMRPSALAAQALAFTVALVVGVPRVRTAIDSHRCSEERSVLGARKEALAATMPNGIRGDAPAPRLRLRGGGKDAVELLRQLGDRIKVLDIDDSDGWESELEKAVRAHCRPRKRRLAVPGGSAAPPTPCPPHRWEKTARTSAARRPTHGSPGETLRPRGLEQRLRPSPRGAEQRPRRRLRGCGSACNSQRTASRATPSRRAPSAAVHPSRGVCISAAVHRR